MPNDAQLIDTQTKKEHQQVFPIVVPLGFADFLNGTEKQLVT